MDREKRVPPLLESLNQSRDQAHLIREGMPWVTEQEQKDLEDKIAETRDWIDKKIEEQEKRTLLEEPAFTMAELDKEAAKMTKLAKKIFGKRKPKPQKPKKEEKEEEKKESDGGEEAKTDSSEEAKSDPSTDKKEDDL